MQFDSDEELEPFQLTGSEFRRGRKQTKEEKIYGMWAEPDSDEEDSKRLPLYTDYSNFVKHEDSGAGNEGAASDGDSDVDDANLDEEAKQILQGYERQKMSKGGDDSSVRGFKSSALNKNKSLHAFEPSQPSKSSGKRGMTHSGSGAKQNPTWFQPSTGNVLEKDFGRWEKHTTGFGSKMLAKMGWKSGQGLGSRGVGIVNPVKAQKHTDFGKGLVHMQISKHTEEAVDSEDDEEQKKFEEELQQWKKTEGSSKSVKPKYRYKTVGELMESGKRYQTREVKSHAVKVIDMTGPKQRVLSSYEEIHDRHSRPDEVSHSVTDTASKLFLPELLHNVQLLVDRTEQDILHSDRKLSYNRDLVVNLGHEKEELWKEIQEEEMQINKLADILNVIEICEDRLVSSEGPPLSLDYCQKVMTDLQTKYPLEYRSYNLSSVAVAILFPLIKKSLLGWDMLECPEEPTCLFSVWRKLLKESESSHSMPSTDHMDPYDRLVWEVWMPKLRTCLFNWSPKHPNLLIDLLELWMPLLPPWVFDNILDQLVLPRLQQEVENWDPTTDPVPINSWVHPWLPLMEKRMEVLYVPIRHKLAIALNNWHPSDSSAYNVIKPWVNVFSPQTMEAFLLRTVLPKLGYCLQLELTIHPNQQDIAPLKWILAWRDLIPAHYYASIFEKYFFPKWIQALSTWLQQSPNFDEVTRWYTGWKSQLDPEVLREPSVKHHMNHALDMMNRAVAGTYQPGARENIAYLITTERRNTPSYQNAMSAPATVSFKDLIEKLAEDHGILFMPVPGQRRYEGKALYSFGRATIYIDRGVSFVMIPDSQTWRPVSMDDLLKFA